MSGSEGDSSDIAQNHVYSLKQEIYLSDLQKEGSTFELDIDKDLAEYVNIEDRDYFDKEEILGSLKYPYEDADEESESDDSQDEREPFQRKMAKMEALTPDNGVMRRIIKPGYGSVPPEKAQVTIHYHAYLEYGDEPLDSSRLRKQPFRFILNCGEAIAGLDIGVSHMRKSEVSEFLFQADYGFGKMGCPPRIPAGAAILYVVELLDFIDYSAAVKFSEMSSDDRKNASFSEVLGACKVEHRAANELFKMKNYSKALFRYNNTIRRLSDASMKNEEEEKDQQKFLVKLFCNVSQCHLNLNSPDRAIPCCLSALKIDPTNTKALFRCGKASRLCGKHGDAKRFLRQAAQREPNNEEIAKEIAVLEKDIQMHTKLEKEFCARIFPGNTLPAKKTLDQNISNEFKLNVQKNLKEFIENNQINVLPFTQGFSDSEIRAVEIIATDLGLECFSPKNGNIKLKVCKKDKRDDK